MRVAPANQIGQLDGNARRAVKQGIIPLDMIAGLPSTALTSSLSTGASGIIADGPVCASGTAGQTSARSDSRYIGLAQGSFIELVIKPASNEEPIKIGTAMECSSRPESMGIRFLDMVADDKNRLSQVILSLLVGQSLHPNLLA